MIIRIIPSLILLLFSQFILSQEYSKSQLKKISIEIIKNSNFCVFITLDSLGNPRARLMDSYMPNNDFVVYLITNPFSRKVKQLENDSRVVLNFQNINGDSYVTISGSSVLIDDSEYKEKYWKESWTTHYKDRVENSLLIKVIPKTLEIISIPNNVVGDSITWKPKTIVF
ncbi:MAG: pyridoxamine 5'-phosphate oxidase family protein [Flavobacteriales bacterium]|jgi:general stress protein 26|tara:strand:- start:7809 stop:8318 length:510 start_codon:yes stop_codon:yes gene_type:complete